jgi:thiopurine S-methyltransferase
MNNNPYFLHAAVKSRTRCYHPGEWGGQQIMPFPAQDRGGNVSEEWLGRWEQGRIGWHESAGNVGLKKHWINLPPGSRVLVPLCGKARDLLWLAEAGCSVTGVELSRIAVEAFFTENELPFDARSEQGMTRFRARDRDITLYSGDYLQFADEPFDALYDRGALVALPSDVRAAYASHTDRLLNDGALRIVITLEYDQSRVAGPPFSVMPEELLAFWPDLVRVDEVEDIDNAPPKFRAAGLEHMLEVVWRSAGRE